MLFIIIFCKCLEIVFNKMASKLALYRNYLKEKNNYQFHFKTLKLVMQQTELELLSPNLKALSE